jgi:hypothetical protein
MITVTINLQGKLMGAFKERHLCIKKTQIDESVIEEWKKVPVDRFNKSNWNKRSEREVINAYIATFDEGYGVSWDYVA